MQATDLYCNAMSSETVTKKLCEQHHFRQFGYPSSSLVSFAHRPLRHVLLLQVSVLESLLPWFFQAP